MGISGKPIIAGGDFRSFIDLDTTLLTISEDIEPIIIPVSKHINLFVFY